MTHPATTQHNNYNKKIVIFKTSYMSVHAYWYTQQPSPYTYIALRIPPESSECIWQHEMTDTNPALIMISIIISD